MSENPFRKPEGQPTPDSQRPYRTEQTYERESTDPRNRHRVIFAGQSRLSSPSTPQMAWGAGETEHEARNEFRKAGGLLAWPHNVLTLPEHIAFRGVDNSGQVHTVNLSVLPGTPYPDPLTDEEVLLEMRSGALNNHSNGKGAR